MTVDELITELHNYPGDMAVVSGDGLLSDRTDRLHYYPPELRTAKLHLTEDGEIVTAGRTGIIGEHALEENLEALIL